MTYTLHLILLECLQAQEADGDEPYLKLGEEIVMSWKTLGVHMADTLNRADWTNAFDFRTCKYRTLDGWQAVEGYEPQHFIFNGLQGDVRLQLWESDEGNPLRGDDDLLGELVINEGSIRMGDQTTSFDRQGAIYDLTYRVSEG